jgi:hypothetical protein
MAARHCWMSRVPLALATDEVDHRHIMVAAEPVNRGDEPLADRIHQRRGRERLAPMNPEEPHHPVDVLQAGHVQVAVHPVDRLDLQDQMIGQDISDTARYGHHKLRSWARRKPTNRFERFKTRCRKVTV